MYQYICKLANTEYVIKITHRTKSNRNDGFLNQITFDYINELSTFLLVSNMV